MQQSALPQAHLGSASPAMPWGWLALTEITIVVDFINRVSEVLKARRVSRGYPGWTAWMPHAHWYGLPSLPARSFAFSVLAAVFWDLQMAACPRITWQFPPYLPPSHLPHTATIRKRPFPSSHHAQLLAVLLVV